MASSVIEKPTDTGDPPSNSHYRRTLSSSKLATIAGPAGGKRAGTLATYLRLVEGKRLLIPAVWLFQNLRNAPVWIFPLLSGYLFDLLKSAPQRVGGELWWVMLVTFGLCVLNVVATSTQQFLRSRQRRALTAGLRQALMRRLHQLTFVFHDRARAGVLQNKFILDLNRLEELQNYLCEAWLLNATTCIICLSVIAGKNLTMTAMLLAAVIANLVIGRLLWRPMRRRSEEFRHAESSLLSFLTEALSGVRLTRAHAVEEFTEERLGVVAAAVAAKGVKVDTINAIFGSSAWAVSSVVNMAVLGYGAWSCAQGGITIGELMVYISYYAIVAGGMGNIIGGMPTVASASDAIASLSELYAAGAEEANDGKPALAQLRGAIELRGVTFRYAGSERHSIAGVDLAIPAGGSLALVGSSGSGKSTIASLILGFYEPEAGAVLIDGHDLRAIDRRSVRRQVGVVSQDVVLFHDTVIDNIAWGDPKPDEQRVREAARRANADEFIERLPQKYQTLLGDRGAGLSGGQRQRLAIARALYRNPALLILDEATSALDQESERLVQQALETLMRGRTTVIIAHRLSTVRNADRIVVLGEGKVVEGGTFAELMERKGAFYAMATGQLTG